MNQRSSRLPLVTALLISASFAGTAFAQAASAVITKSFSPAVVALNGTSIGTITVTNPNAVPLTNVQFNDTMPAGIDLITQTGGTCSTLATGEASSPSIPARRPFPAHRMCLPRASPARLPSAWRVQPSAHTSTRRRKSLPTRPHPAPPRQERSQWSMTCPHCPGGC